ncbi:MAG TPA: helicase HerA-like domain-containing protein [Gammaproteobacteria bacterium]|nr:helicase HerA-like domain-containing protein [Gammaproteobacteria bacterium]
MADPLLVAKAGTIELCLLPALVNRHGLITGATGTGKTVSLQTIAEQLSRIGVPVFMADVKGDLSGLAVAGGSNAKVTERAAVIGVELRYEACPVVFWDVFGKRGHPIRATVSDLGPLLLARLLQLNDTQEGVLNLTFKIADDAGLLLLDVKDLRAMLQHVGEHAAELTTEYGNVSAASVGAIQRGLLALESQGVEQLFGEPMLNIDDLLQTESGKGVINILAADRLMSSPKLYATLLLWMLSELFERLPEVGDPEKPRLVFFFDEAHLLFNDAPKALLEKIEQVVRLIRSKGVGVYFVTQNPLDIPDAVLGQLGNRLQHALRAFTPRDQRAVKSAAETMRPNPKFAIEQAITELGVGEALVSLLDEKGRPGVTERALIVPPGSQLGPIEDATRARLVAASPVAGVYDKTIDRESAYERLKGRAEEPPPQERAPTWQRESAPAQRVPPQAQPQPQTSNDGGFMSDILFGRRGPRGGRQTQGVVEAMAKSAARSVGSQAGRALIRGVLGSLLGGRR